MFVPASLVRVNDRVHISRENITSFVAPLSDPVAVSDYSQKMAPYPEKDPEILAARSAFFTVTPRVLSASARVAIFPSAVVYAVRRGLSL